MRQAPIQDVYLAEVKRQATWFRSEPGVVRVTAAECEAAARERLGWA